MSTLLLAAASLQPVGAQTMYRVVVLGPGNSTVTSAAGASFGQIVGYVKDESGKSGAALWNRSFSAVARLHPDGFDESFLRGVFDDQQVGYGSLARQESSLPHALFYPGEPRHHALLWSGSSSSVVDLNPSGYGYSYAEAAYAGVQVGSGMYLSPVLSPRHALLWHGSAVSFVDLHPKTLRTLSGLVAVQQSAANCVSGSMQGGAVVSSDLAASTRAVVWRGTAESVVDFHPSVSVGSTNSSPYIQTEIHGISLNDLVGFGMIATNRLPIGVQGWPHALLWHGSATNYVDLNPDGFGWSYAVGNCGNQQVGYGGTTGLGDNAASGLALTWMGTAKSVVNLHQFLPAHSPAFEYSRATGIDEFGNIVGVAGWISKSSLGQVTNDRAVIWIPFPDSGSRSMLRVAPWWQAGGKLKMQLMGETGATYSLESSRNFGQWSVLVKTNLPAVLCYFPQFQGLDQQWNFFKATLVTPSTATIYRPFLPSDMLVGP